MASRTADERTAPRLYLVTPLVEDAEGFARVLEAALLAADIAAVLLRLPIEDENALTNRVKHLAPVVQARGAALLLNGHARLVARGGADGAHFADISAFEADGAGLQPARIAGVGGLITRHEAMQAAELGADYVMFGEPDGEGRVPSLAAACERLAWWSEVFQVPCVGYAASADAVAVIAKTGAEFVALGPDVWTGDPPASVSAAAAAMTAARLAMESV